MATVTLELEEERDGQLVFVFQVDPFDAPPFAGPADRGWDAFVVHTPGNATYQWRTGADLERDVARRLVATGLERGAVDAAFANSDYLRRVDEDADTELEGFARRVEILEKIASNEWDPAAADAPWSYYHFEGDEWLDEAAEVLPLPPGAVLEDAFGGGPGSGYADCYLVLAPGQTLADLAGWLKQQRD